MPAKTSNTKKLLLAFSGLGAFYLLTSKDVPEVLNKTVKAVSDGVRNMSLPRGLRNNNPLNLRKGVNWIGRNGDDGAFDIFKTMDYGIRAALTNIKTAYTKHKCTTVAKLITRWAPPSENDTKKYIDFVCKTTPISANEIINISDKDTLAGIIYSMAQMENGPDVTKKNLSLSTVQAVVNQYA